MSINNQPSLILFEEARRKIGFIPPKNSNSFYNIGEGEINLLTIRDDIDNYRFSISTNDGTIHTGNGTFSFVGESNNTSTPYKDLTIIEDTSVIVDNIISFENTTIEIYGTLEMLKGSRLNLKNNTNIIFYPSSNFILDSDTTINIDINSSITIYGTVNVDLDKVDYFIKHYNINMDTMAVLNVSNINMDNRCTSVLDYEKELRNKIININTQGETNYVGGRLGYEWTNGSPANNSYSIKMNVLYGDAILGDFRVSALGIPLTDNDLKIISDVKIFKDSTLYISESFKGYTYIKPELYLGIIDGNNKIPATLSIDGTVIVDGINSKIIVDRGAIVYINESGKIYLKNNGSIINSYNDNTSLVIDGELIIDSIEQISTFTHSNIKFGNTGKIIILNPDNGERKLLFSTPNGIKSSLIYELFSDRMNHLEFHISNNTGIKIDEFYEYYYRDMTEWIGPYRIEKAIKDGIIVWHDGGFIELSSDIIPWVDNNSNLLQACRIFKSFGDGDTEKLQDTVNRLKYAGSGNIVFRFIVGDNSHEAVLNLNGINTKSIIYNPSADKYIISTNNNGYLFLNKYLSEISTKEIINNHATVVNINDAETNFKLKGNKL